MYYMKLKDINEAFSRNFISPPFIWSITTVYLGLVLLANTIARYNAPYILTVPERIWPAHPGILSIIAVVYFAAHIVFFFLGTSMETSKNPVKKRLGKVYFLMSQFMYPTLIVDMIIRLTGWLVTNTVFMIGNISVFFFYKLPYRLLDNTEKEPKKKKHDLKTVLNDVEALVKR